MGISSLRRHHAARAAAAAGQRPQPPVSVPWEKAQDMVREAVRQAVAGAKGRILELEKMVEVMPDLEAHLKDALEERSAACARELAAVEDQKQLSELVNSVRDEAIAAGAKVAELEAQIAAIADEKSSLEAQLKEAKELLEVATAPAEKPAEPKPADPPAEAPKADGRGGNRSR